MGEQKEWSFLIWEERKGLLGAAALEYPEPFALLGPYLAEAPKEAVERLSWFLKPGYTLKLLEALQNVPPEDLASKRDFSVPPWVGILAWQALEKWRFRAWPPKPRFPLKWRPWAYPLLADAAVIFPDCPRDSLLAAFYIRHFTHLGFGQATSSCPEPEPPIPWGFESEKDYLKRAKAFYHDYQAYLYEKGLEKARTWRTRQRDLIFLVWHEVEGLTEEEIAHRVEERIRTGHRTARYLFEGRKAEPLGEDRTGSLPELIHKAIVLTRERLRIT